ncbi:hypothetical protein AB0J01_37975 [Streptomyces sp. NPDC050204]|uniref:hypothetical protein n=1 Tax=Streptomyces sp. NPDC050204 TaxID=3155514 RepID=UPI003444C5A7
MTGAQQQARPAELEQISAQTSLEGCVYEPLLRIVEMMVDERRDGRGAFVSLLELVSSVTTAACSGQWSTAMESAAVLQELFATLDKVGHPGAEAALFPAQRVELRLRHALECLGYPAEIVDRLREALEQSEPVTSLGMHRDALRAELCAFAHRNARRDELILQAVAAEISEVETARLSAISRNTVRAVRGRARSQPPPGGSAVPTQNSRHPAPTVLQPLFLAPEPQL